MPTGKGRPVNTRITGAVILTVFDFQSFISLKSQLGGIQTCLCTRCIHVKIVTCLILNELGETGDKCKAGQL